MSLQNNRKKIKTSGNYFQLPSFLEEPNFIVKEENDESNFVLKEEDNFEQEFVIKEEDNGQPNFAVKRDNVKQEFIIIDDDDDDETEFFPRKSSKISNQKPNHMEIEMDDTDADDEDFYELFPEKNSEKSNIKNKEKKRASLRGNYKTLSKEVREIIFQILHEQAQIYYDIKFNKDIDPELKRKRKGQLLTNKEIIKEELSANQIFLLSRLSFDPVTNEMKNFEIVDLSKKAYVFYSGNIYSQEDQLLTLLEKSVERHLIIETDQKPMQKIGNMIIEVPLKPLNIPLTIQKRDIIKYLTCNEDESSLEKQSSIFQELSRLTKIHKKSLKRIAISGPQRKKGGGRQRLDSIMEKKLTVYVIELNKRGRPPTREEVVRLAQLLRTVNNFRASKGWLDRYLKRVQNELNQNPGSEKYFRLMPAVYIKTYESKKPILSCLEEMGASSEFIEKFKELKKKNDINTILEEIEVKQEIEVADSKTKMDEDEMKMEIE